MPLPNGRYLPTPAIAGPSNGRRGPYGRKRSGQFRNGRRCPLLSLSAVPVHPSLMRQFQFQSRLRITETGTVSQIPILAMETISQSQRATHMTPLALCQQCQRSAKPGARVHVCATFRQLHACNMSFCSRRRKVAGAPRSRSSHGEGVGRDFVRQPEN